MNQSPREIELKLESLGNKEDSESNRRVLAPDATTADTKSQDVKETYVDSDDENQA
jgi:zinc transporter ZupT